MKGTVKFFNAEGIDIFKNESGDFYGMTQKGVQYYFALKPEKASLSKAQRAAKTKYMHRYILIVRD